jgi:hypothetical protein
MRQTADDLRAVVIAGGFAGGEKDARIGISGDEPSLIVSTEPHQSSLFANI